MSIILIHSNFKVINEKFVQFVPNCLCWERSEGEYKAADIVFNINLPVRDQLNSGPDNGCLT